MNSTPIRLSYIRWFQEIGIEDVPLVGGKNASLGELYQELVPKGIHVPNGFAITADAYWDLLGRTRLDQRIKEILSGLDTQDAANLQQRGNAVRRQLVGAALPDDLQAEIIAAYHQLCEGAAEPVDVAVRSSATAEDLPDASFAGQQETYLNVQGEAALLESCKRCFASLFTDRAISYRQDKGFDHLKVGLSIGIQRMVRSDLASSGVMFSIDTESGFPDVVLIDAAYGLGENVVQGSVTPAE
jgi:pyruvate,water dikinase